MLRLAAVISLLAVTAASARDVSVPPAAGEDMRVKEAPVDFPVTADLMEVASGVVWPVLEDGHPSPKATKVPHGVYITAAGYSNMEKSVAREVDGLKAEVARLNAELAKRNPPGVPVSDPSATTTKWSKPAVIAIAVVSLAVGGYAGCRLTGGCK